MPVGPSGALSPAIIVAGGDPILMSAYTLVRVNTDAIFASIITRDVATAKCQASHYALGSLRLHSACKAKQGVLGRPR